MFIVLRDTTFISTFTFSSPRFTTSIVPHFLCPTSQLSRHNNGRSNPEVVGSIPNEVKRIFSLPRLVPWFPLLGLTPGVGLSWVSHSTLIYTSELILCSTIKKQGLTTRITNDKLEKVRLNFWGPANWDVARLESSRIFTSHEHRVCGLQWTLIISSWQRKKSLNLGRAH